MEYTYPASSGNVIWKGYTNKPGQFIGRVFFYSDNEDGFYNIIYEESIVIDIEWRWNLIWKRKSKPIGHKIWGYVFLPGRNLMIFSCGIRTVLELTQKRKAPDLLKPRKSGTFHGCGSRIWTYDLRVMSGFRGLFTLFRFIV